MIEDWLPAGLEAIDPNLANGHDSLGGSRNECPRWLWFYACTTFERETKKDRVRFYSDFLFAGTHTVQYEAVAATRGEFVLPPTRAAVVLQPEVMGASASGVLRISDASSKGSPAELSSAPKQCPSDCLGRGRCDIV